MKFHTARVTDYWIIGWSFALMGVTAVSIVPSFSPPNEFDKELHFISYFLLTIIPLARIQTREIAFLCSGFMPVLGFGLEYIQRNISGREFSPEDMIANNIGAVMGICIGILLRLNKRFKRIARRKP